MRRRLGVCAIIFCVLVLSCAVPGVAQVNTATLSGTVIDPQGLAVRGARVTVTNAATDASRSLVVDEDGRYTFIGLAPGRYKMSVDGGANFAAFQNDSIVVTVERQTNTGGQWQDSPVSRKLVDDLENDILQRAREVHIARLRVDQQ